MRKFWDRVRAVLAQRFGIETWADVRNVIHLAAPSIAGALVSWNLMEADKAKLIGALIAALASPLLAVPYSKDVWRSYIYGVLAAGQAVLIGVLGMTESQVAPIIGAVLALVGGSLASTNTPRSHAGLKDKTA
ncbi:holin [Mycobacterium phage JF1]|nr:holin [Mycobacterium phage JF1]